MKASGPINFAGYNGLFTLFKKIRDRYIARNGRRRSKKKLKENMAK